ncbi:MAG: hypothetical protein OQK67_00635 [Chlorobium sp.]|nr:hypothetical protein [Chlorobium sp.]MCW8815110.1 hypothetical protein [Chlorobium sp.]MCW8820007.1 hypothetical protein [Ignavibacteriaceae bacterium]
MQMKLMIRRCVACMATVTACVVWQGCTPEAPYELSQTDKRFAAFYADYMLLSGVADSARDSVAVPGMQTIDSLLDVHTLTMKEFNERAETYRQEPKLWRAILLEVKNNLRDRDE